MGYQSSGMADEIKDAISTNAQGPKAATGDTGSVTQHSITEQIAADRYVKASGASRKKFGGLKLTKIAPPGAI